MSDSASSMPEGESPLAAQTGGGGQRYGRVLEQLLQPAGLIQLALLVIGIGCLIGAAFLGRSAMPGTSPVVWREIDLPVEADRLDGLSALAAGTGDTEVLFAGTVDNGVFRTLDDGASWQAFGKIEPQSPVRSLLVSPFEDRLYAATENGLFFSSLTAPDWHREPDLPAGHFLTLAASQDRDRQCVYLGGLVTGLYRKCMGDEGWTAFADSELQTSAITGLTMCGDALWIITSDSLRRVDTATGETTPVDRPPLIDDSATSMVCAEGHLYFTTPTYLAAISEDGSQYEKLPSPFERIGYPRLLMLLEGTSQHLLTTSGWSLYDIDTTGREPAKVTAIQPSLPGSTRVVAVAHSPRRSYIGFTSGYILRRESTQEQWQPVNIPWGYIQAVTADKTSDYLVTGQAIYRYDRDSGVLGPPQALPGGAEFRALAGRTVLLLVLTSAGRTGRLDADEQTWSWSDPSDKFAETFSRWR